MAQLMDSKNKVLASELRIADQMLSRMKGLLGSKGLSSQEALWIHRCNSIHTFFMKFPIDCVFLDQDLKVKALIPDIKPGRMTMPVWGAHSVVEMKAGQIQNLNLSVGEQLYVRP